MFLSNSIILVWSDSEQLRYELVQPVKTQSITQKYIQTHDK